MNKIEEIEKIRNFFLSENKNIIINQVSDDVDGLFKLIIEYYGQKYNIKVNENYEQNNNINDLFSTNEIKFCKTTSTKKIEELLNFDEKKIIMTDYRNFKKFNKKVNFINAYNFEMVIEKFINEDLKINDHDLIFFCKNNPILLFSETSKYLINDNGYSYDQKIHIEKNFILDLRKSIYEIKKNKNNIKLLYEKIKDEANYKKLNFLTY